MPSTFAFYRARGVAGAYVVGIQLDLLPTESATLSMQSRGRFEVKSPSRIIKRQEDEWRWLYRINRICAGDRIDITISDRQLVPSQDTRFTATAEGFTKTENGYHRVKTSANTEHDFGLIVLNDISMIDLDTEDVIIHQEERVVEAAPSIALPKPKRKRIRKPKPVVSVVPIAPVPEEPLDNHPEQPAVVEDPTFQF